MGLAALDEGTHESAHESERTGYRRRFVWSFAGDARSCFSIGFRDSFAEYRAPIWMRFHRDTGSFAHIRERIEASTLKWVESSGYVWLPLFVPFDTSREVMVRELIEQRKRSCA